MLKVDIRSKVLKESDRYNMLIFYFRLQTFNFLRYSFIYSTRNSFTKYFIFYDIFVSHIVVQQEIQLVYKLF
ncbi:unnamed protein product [Rotaria socialis]|uniref:Uncharacterized protein n=2 Tax=Rotaria socialis TaxID=392032 RepID=A0A818GYT1_9BILA|nr:unnamed protein product [Rotaria socialis]